MSLDPRLVTAAEYPDWLRAVGTGFLRASAAVPGEEEVAVRLAHTDLARVQGVFDAGRCVATFRSFAQELTVVGGAKVRADAVTAVTVTPTHRRRGLLSRMMATDLAAAKERGDVVASLIAAEYPIYGRYGFGPAAWATEWEIDVPRAGLDPRARIPSEADGGRIELVDGADVRKLGPELHTRLAARQHGVVSRDERWWQRSTGVDLPAYETWTEPFYAVYRSADGETDGLIAYRADDRWGDGKQPLNKATVVGMTAVTPAAERALWQFVCSIDWITTVRTGYRAPDDLVPLLLPDPRAARVVTYADWLWLRVLDVPRALEARTYATGAALVLDVRDPAGLAGGRFLLEVSPSGASCVPTTRDADLSLDVGELGTLYLGDESALRLAALGRIEEHRAGAAAEADTVFRAPRRAWCPDVF
ncbi:GNAT family N-acetyltransferase [[Kitasatospora] papulosa]|uniref:GNAT family N-acetyltransferase n=1 Tax=[Kitasatospora] papulosa TaxID=1464011 RepID=A0ABZ1K5B6_9ACTN|nr:MULTISPECIES: GNAT family N-acetyltransferase [Streptomyces]MBD2833103.1 GNAT family N-acetyltransferase [Streptomyces pratensis]RAS29952.1 putative acetyltransferase [Streptomyces avidinii]TPN15828.1 GNAT family N-acetyltransferase [Mesorhizobium sp. B2-3-3]SNX77675.1 Predicted acetyltransferase [Streptomyces microflavus]MDX2620844.1 GNAT family N-acetyltransferase [Streptomyces sp. WI03-5b]